MERSLGLPVALIVGACLLLGAAAIGASHRTEARYLEISAAMADGGDFVVPRYGGIPHLHKPPWAYWLSAAGLALLGRRELSARLPVLLAGGWSLFLLWSLFKSAGDAKRGWYAAGVLGTTALFLGSAKFVSADVYVVLFLTLAYYGFWRGGREKPEYYWLVVFGLAGGVLAKGPVILYLFTGGAGLFCWWRGGFPRLSARGWFLGAAAFLLLTLTWPVLAAFREEGLASYWAKHLLHRLAGGAEEPWYHYRPPYYYLAVLLAGALPWTPHLLAVAAFLVHRWRQLNDLEALFCCWGGWTLIGLSLLASKGALYLAPGLPAVAGLIAGRLAGSQKAPTAPAGGPVDAKPESERRPAWQRYAPELWLCPAALAMLAVGAAAKGWLGHTGIDFAERIADWSRLGAEVVSPAAGVLLFLGAGLLLALAAGRLLSWRWPAPATFFVSALVPLVVVVALVRHAPEVNWAVNSGWRFAPVLKTHARPGDHLVFYRFDGAGLLFYAQGLKPVYINVRRDVTFLAGAGSPFCLYLFDLDEGADWLRRQTSPPLVVVRRDRREPWRQARRGHLEDLQSRTGRRAEVLAETLELALVKLRPPLE